MTHPVVFTRNPDAVLYDADLGDAAWEAKTGNKCAFHASHL